MKLLKEIIVLLKDIKNLLEDIKMMLLRESFVNYTYPYYVPEEEYPVEKYKYYQEPDTTFGQEM